MNVVGTRPNFVKIAPLLREMRRCPTIVPILVHTGQHYDATMSEQFFADLELPPPNFNLGVGSGSHATQTAEVMRRLEPMLDTMRPDLVLVVGDSIGSPIGFYAEEESDIPIIMTSQQVAISIGVQQIRRQSRLPVRLRFITRSSQSTHLPTVSLFAHLDWPICTG